MMRGVVVGGLRFGWGRKGGGWWWFWMVGEAGLLLFL